MLATLRDYIRPVTLMALLFVLLTGAVTSGLLELWAQGLGVRFTVGVAGWFKAIPDAYYQLSAAALLGYTAARTIDKAMKGRKPDDPDGELQ